MVSPSNPEVKGDSEVYHDGRPDSAHEAEVRKAEGTSTKSDESNEGSSEQTGEERGYSER